MNGPDSGNPTPEFSDSDLQWYAALTGDPPRDPNSAAVREGLALRVALEQRRLEIAASPDIATATSDEAMQRQLQQLRQRIQREGVFDRPQAAASNVIEFPWWRRRGALLAMAASVLVAVVLVQQITSQPDYPQPPTMMGADGIQQLRVAQPRQAAEAWAAQLRQAGLRPGLYQRGTTYVVDVNLMAAELPAAEPAFAALKLKPAVGFNRVEFSLP
jgi:hypothetical protein